MSIFFVPPDFETTWEKVETSEPDDAGYIDWSEASLPDEPPDGTVSAFRDPASYESFVVRTGDGTLYTWDEESGTEWQSIEWQKTVVPAANIKQTVVKIEKLVEDAKTALKEAVKLAKENGIRLYLEGNVYTPNVEVNGDCWETSTC